MMKGADEKMVNLKDAGWRTNSLNLVINLVRPDRCKRAIYTATAMAYEYKR